MSTVFTYPSSTTVVFLDRTAWPIWLLRWTPEVWLIFRRLTSSTDLWNLQSKFRNMRIKFTRFIAIWQDATSRITIFLSFGSSPAWIRFSFGQAQWQKGSLHLAGANVHCIISCHREITVAHPQLHTEAYCSFDFLPFEKTVPHMWVSFSNCDFGLKV